MPGRWYRQACDEARAAKLRRDRPGYRVAGGDGSWTAVHAASRTAFGPMPLRRLAAAIEDHAWRRASLTVNGAEITIRGSR